MDVQWPGRELGSQGVAAGVLASTWREFHQSRNLSLSLTRGLLMGAWVFEAMATIPWMVALGLSLISLLCIFPSARLEIK
jgi:hypothetical protein